MNSGVISKAEFLETIWKLYEKGDPEKAYNEMVYAIVSTKKTFTGEEITADFIKTKWEQYLAKCKKDVREDRYIKSLESWLKAKDYQVNYSYHLAQTVSDKSTKRKRYRE